MLSLVMEVNHSLGIRFSSQKAKAMKNENSRRLILMIEDDRDISDIICRYFDRDGFRAIPVFDGAAAVTETRRLRPDLVVLDVNIPKMDGFAVLSQLRTFSNVPVIMATALGQDLDKLTALRIGADDYVVKPFNPLELVARAHAVLRRSYAGEGLSEVLRVGNVEIDLENTAVKVAGEEGSTLTINVTASEFRIMAYLARHPERAYSRIEILNNCLSESSNATERTIDSHMHNIRKKLEGSGCHGLIKSVHGIGYRFT